MMERITSRKNPLLMKEAGIHTAIRLHLPITGMTIQQGTAQAIQPVALAPEGLPPDRSLKQ